MIPATLITFFGSIQTFLVVLFAIGALILNILMSIAITDDMVRLRAKNRPIIILTPFLWTLSALFLGLLAVAFYWLCHYSRLTRKDP